MTASESLLLIVAGPASHSPALLDEMQALAVRLGETLDCAGVAAAWFDQGRPALPDVLNAAVEQGTTTIVVLPYLLQWSYPDQFSLPDLVHAFARANPSVHVRLAAPLGLTPAIEEQLLTGVRAARDGADITAIEAQAVRDAAYQDPPAVRHPAAPVYPAARHHILLCNGRPCLDAGATALEAGLRSAISAAGVTNGPNRVQLTRTRCLGPCRGAAIVTVYPNGDWYHGVAPEQAADLLATITGDGTALIGQQFRPGSKEGHDPLPHPTSARRGCHVGGPHQPRLRPHHGGAWRPGAACAAAVRH